MMQDNDENINKMMRLKSIIAIIVVGCGIMGIVDGVIQPGYGIKSAIKIVLFLAVPLIYSLWDGLFEIKKVFVFKRKGLLKALVLGLFAYVFILGCYFIIGPFFDFSNVTSSLQKNIGIKKENFVFVAIYISFVNSLLEEFFFRGFAFVNLKKLVSRSVAYIISSSAFSLYHIAMMGSWFSMSLFILLLAALFLSGVMFIWLNEKQENIYMSWFVHMFANFAINTVGFILFGIL